MRGDHWKFAGEDSEFQKSFFFPRRVPHERSSPLLSGTCWAECGVPQPSLYYFWQSHYSRFDRPCHSESERWARNRMASACRVAISFRSHILTHLVVTIDFVILPHLSLSLSHTTPTSPPRRSLSARPHLAIDTSERLATGSQRTHPFVKPCSSPLAIHCRHPSISSHLAPAVYHFSHAAALPLIECVPSSLQRCHLPPHFCPVSPLVPFLFRLSRKTTRRVRLPLCHVNISLSSPRLGSYI